MSRNPKNPELARLLRERGLQVADLAGLCACSPRTVHRYEVGFYRRSRIEPRLAAALNLSVPQLRRRLFLTVPRKP